MAKVKDIQEYRKREHKKQNKRAAIKIVIAVLIIAIAITFVAMYESIFGESILESLGLVEAPKGYPVALVGGTPKNIITLGENSALITDTEVVIYDKYGTLSVQQGHDCTNPCVRTNGNRGIIYDVGYHSYLLLNGTASAKAGEHDNQIISAAIASNGSYAIASASSKYLTELVVKSKNDTQLASWKSVSNYINAVAFSEDSTRVAATALYTDGGLAKTALRILDLKNEQQPVVADKEFVGSAAIAISYLDNGNIILVCDDRTVITDQNGETLFNYSYKGNLYYYNLNKYGAFVISEKDGEYTATMLYDAKNAGESIEISEQFKAEEHNGKGIYILEDDVLTKYDRSFRRQSEQSDLTDAIGIACGQNGTYLLTFTQIQQLQQGE